jgi:hypothetical protein
VCLVEISKNRPAKHRIRYLWWFFGQTMPMTVEDGKKKGEKRGLSRMPHSGIFSSYLGLIGIDFLGTLEFSKSTFLLC